MDRKRIPIGLDNFQALINDGFYYVDKTKFIEEVITGDFAVALFPRPRRFGKTLSMSMLENFFNIEKKEENKDLFKDLYISKTEIYKELNTYPTIFLSFKNLKQNTFESVYNQFVILMKNLYNSKDYVTGVLNEAEKAQFKKIQFGEGNIDETKEALNALISYLSRYYNKKVVLLIDEYDVPIQQGYIKGYYDEVVDLIRTIFSNSLKGNNNLKVGVLTGVLRVSKESIFSDLNNVKVYGIYDSSFGEYFGFTTDETEEFLEYYDLELTSEVKDTYDGYSFNGVEIYNPWSIINYAESGRLNTYWINTSGNDLIKEILSKTNQRGKKIIEDLVGGKSALFVYNDKITYIDFDNYDNIDIILNLMFSSGYLTVDKVIEGNTYVKIPNREVKTLITGIMAETIYKGGFNLFVLSIKQCIENHDLKEIEELLNEALDTTSYMDCYEYFYHGYLLGIFKSCLDSSNYIVKSNREAGSGRYDVMIEKVDKTFGYIFEFKVAKTKEEMEYTATTALSQIEDKEYYKELVLDKVKDIHKVAIVFSGKRCIVRGGIK